MGKPVTWSRESPAYFAGRGDDQPARSCRALLVRPGHLARRCAARSPACRPGVSAAQRQLVFPLVMDVQHREGEIDMVGQERDPPW